ncbi:hypothetical protein [Hoyosella subflava]|uniref:Lipoprotein n=1 Tax=Hoyosella subflava (strain DSM 45089 / JCM 17490 / NBRC 109087 / DQS3-9A1) TaxID=443218 RepID=F6ELJ4_HOYSD|nr:hypothetical protein [Hoyosella subflava]AEF40244.1 hypothetical protein AS9A_1795 [Hoyosella subflava DQS3-9A1]
MRRTFAALTAACISITGCGSVPAPTPETDTFPTEGAFIGASGNLISTSGREACQFPDGRITTGDQVVLRGADNRVLALAELTPLPGFVKALQNSDQPFTCAWSFTFDAVPAGEAGYTRELTGFDSLVVSEADLRESPTVAVRGLAAEPKVLRLDK